MDHPEGEEGELASEDEDPDLYQGDPNLYCYNRGMSWTASHTICTHAGSHAALPSSRFFKRGL